MWEKVCSNLLSLKVTMKRLGTVRLLPVQEPCWADSEAALSTFLLLFFHPCVVVDVDARFKVSAYVYSSSSDFFRTNPASAVRHLVILL